MAVEEETLRKLRKLYAGIKVIKNRPTLETAHEKPLVPTRISEAEL